MSNGPNWVLTCALIQYSKKKISFTDNKKWFNIKVFITSIGTRTEDSMDDHPYARFVKEACTSVGINPGNYIHFGRSVKGVAYDLKELEGYDQGNDD